MCMCVRVSKTSPCIYSVIFVAKYCSRLPILTFATVKTCRLHFNSCGRMIKTGIHPISLNKFSFIICFIDRFTFIIKEFLASIQPPLFFSMTLFFTFEFMHNTKKNKILRLFCKEPQARQREMWKTKAVTIEMKTKIKSNGISRIRCCHTHVAVWKKDKGNAIELFEYSIFARISVTRLN